MRALQKVLKDDGRTIKKAIVEYSHKGVIYGYVGYSHFSHSFFSDMTSQEERIYTTMPAQNEYFFVVECKRFSQKKLEAALARLLNEIQSKEDA